VLFLWVFLTQKHDELFRNRHVLGWDEQVCMYILTRGFVQIYIVRVVCCKLHSFLMHTVCILSTCYYCTRWCIIILHARYVFDARVVCIYCMRYMFILRALYKLNIWFFILHLLHVQWIYTCLLHALYIHIALVVCIYCTRCLYILHALYVYIARVVCINCTGCTHILLALYVYIARAVCINIARVVCINIARIVFIEAVCVHIALILCIYCSSCMFM
jgi:hypothetical protein